METAKLQVKQLRGQPFTALPRRREPFGPSNPMEWRGDLYIGRRQGYGHKVWEKRDEDLRNNTVTVICGSPNTGKSRLQRRMQFELLKDDENQLCLLETDKEENLDWVIRAGWLYADISTFFHNPYIRLCTTAQRQGELIAGVKTDTLGLVYNTGSSLLFGKVAHRLYKKLGRNITERDIFEELTRVFIKREYRADQRNVVAHCLERSELLCEQVGHILNVQRSWLFRALESGRHILVNLTGVKGPAQAYLIHSILVGCYQFQLWRLRRG